MKVNKSQVLMFMLEKLLVEREISSIEVKEKFEITDKTFYRYIQELRAYFSNMFRTEEIVYKKEYKKYYLEG